LDRKRPKKGSNDDWTYPHDPDARITKMKDGRTHLAHKAEHAVDLKTGGVIAVTIQPADKADTETIKETLITAAENLEKIKPQTDGVREVVADKGYHSNELLKDLRVLGIRTYISEPVRGPRHWQEDPAAREAVYANRRRIRGTRGQRLLRQRGEYLERPFAHAYETGGLRRLYLRGRLNILKRVLIHTAALNLALLMRVLVGVGTPRSLQGRVCGLFSRLVLLWRQIDERYCTGSLAARLVTICSIIISATVYF
jgi:transposase